MNLAARTRAVTRVALACALLITAIALPLPLEAGKVRPLFEKELPLAADCYTPQNPDECIWAPDPDEAPPEGELLVLLAPAFETTTTLTTEKIVFTVEVPVIGDVLDVHSLKIADRSGTEELQGIEVREAPDGKYAIRKMPGRWREFHALALEEKKAGVGLTLVLILHVAPDATEEGILESLRAMQIGWTAVSPRGDIEEPTFRRFKIDSDEDRDGFVDVLDVCRGSNADEYVVLGDCSTSVRNRPVGRGCMLNDSVASCFLNTDSFWEALDCMWFVMLQEEANANLDPDELDELALCVETLRERERERSSNGFPQFELVLGHGLDPVVEGEAGAPAGGTFRAALRTIENTSPEGVQAWSIAIRAQNAEIIDITTDGTAGASAASDPQGMVQNGFEHSELTTAPAGTGAVSTVVLSLDSFATLPPEGMSTLARLSWQSTFPNENECAVVRFWYQDGLVGSGDPVENRVVWNELSLAPETRGLVFQLCGKSANWVTYDCDGSGSMDLADGICHLGSMFLGSDQPGCPAAMDFNGDDEMNVADPVALFSYLFLGGAPPVAGLGCNAYAGCGSSCP